MMMMMNTSGV